MRIPILMYHQIDEPPPKGTPMRGLVVSPGSFERQMWLIKAMGYRGVSMRELEPYINGEKQGNVVGITFDDGYENNHTHALKTLMKYKFTATCYVISNMLGKQNSWDLEIGVPQKKLMDSSLINNWIHCGMDIGSHSQNHLNLLSLSTEESLREIHESKIHLENEFKYEVRHFCYPYGKFNSNHEKQVKNAGYITATTTERGRANTTDDLYILPRVLMSKSTTMLHTVLKLATRYEDKRGND